MFAQIPPPPTPANSLLLLAGAMCLVFAAVALLWGRSKGRILMGLVVAAVGAASSPLIARLLGLGTLWPVTLSAAVTGGIMGFLLARLLWAAALGLAVSVAALYAYAALNIDAVEPPAWHGVDAGWPEWSAGVGQYLLEWLAVLWQHSPAYLAACAGAPVVAAAVLGMLLPRVMTAVASSIFGAAGAVAGAGLLVWALRDDWAAAWAYRIHLPAGAVGVLAMGGLVYQTRAHFKARGAGKAEPEAQAAETGPGEPAEPAAQNEA